MTLDFPLWLRAAHFFNLLFLSLLMRSGLEILSAHPKFYWHDDCAPGSEWLSFSPRHKPDGQGGRSSECMNAQVDKVRRMAEAMETVFSRISTMRILSLRD